MRFANSTNDNVQKVRNSRQAEVGNNNSPHSYCLETTGGPAAPTLETGRSPPPPERMTPPPPPHAAVGSDLGSVLLAGWSLSAGPDRIIASNYMVDYQLLVSV